MAECGTFTPIMRGNDSKCAVIRISFDVKNKIKSSSTVLVWNAASISHEGNCITRDEAEGNTAA